MYKLTFPNGSSALVEKPDFIRVHKENCFILCERNKAEGVAYKGSPFLFKDGLMCHEVDAGEAFAEVNEELGRQSALLAETDEAAIELYEASLNQEAVNAEQDEAIIEIYETMEGLLNG